MLRRIMVAVDGSTFAECAVPGAIAIAQETDAELRLVRVVERPSVFGLGERSDAERIEAESYLEALAERICPSCPGTPSVSIRYGAASAELKAEAAEWGADLLVMSTHGRAGLSRVWAGSVAARCAEAAPCPVLLARPQSGGAPNPTAAPRIRRVVVPLDGSLLAEQALDTAISLTSAFGVHALLLSILPEPEAKRIALVPVSDAAVEKRRERRRSVMSTYLARQVTRVRKAGAHAYGMLLTEPDPAASIADRVEGDLVVMATRGHRRLDRALLGSVTDHVVRAASCPVIVIPPALSLEAANTVVATG